MSVVDPFRAPTRDRPRSWAALGVALLPSLVGGCGEPDDATIAREPSSNEGGSRGPRGRVEVVAGELLTDRGSRLRGVTLGSDVGLDFNLQDEPEAARPVVRRLLDRLSLEAGINALHVYLENWQTPTGDALGFADLLVDETARAGLYLVLAIGGGSPGEDHPGTGWFDPEKVSSFWTLYAPRYAARTHVLFELQNAPELTCDAAWSSESLALERDTYTLIRTAAPDSHIVLFSYVAIPTTTSLDSSVTQVSSTIDWSNVSVGFHAWETCAPLTQLASLHPAAPSGPIALLATELPQTDWQLAIPPLEASAIGWMSFFWLRSSSDTDRFKSEHDAAGISWCPDFGSWPMDARSCGGS